MAPHRHHTRNVPCAGSVPSSRLFAPADGRQDHRRLARTRLVHLCPGRRPGAGAGGAALRPQDTGGPLDRSPASQAAAPLAGERLYVVRRGLRRSRVGAARVDRRPGVACRARSSPSSAASRPGLWAAGAGGATPLVRHSGSRERGRRRRAHDDRRSAGPLLDGRGLGIGHLRRQGRHGAGGRRADRRAADSQGRSAGRRLGRRLDPRVPHHVREPGRRDGRQPGVGRGSTTNGRWR